jgi:hypothetical protein
MFYRFIATEANLPYYIFFAVHILYVQYTYKKPVRAHMYIPTAALGYRL